MNSLSTDLPSLFALSELHFLRPLWFLALTPLPWLLWRLRRLDSGAAAWQGLVDAHLLPHLLVGADARIRRLPLVLLACGWLLGVTALAGPVWARLPQPLYQAQGQRVIVLDLSPDMDAQDLAPSRLGRARFEILDLLAAAAEGQTALLAYGPEPFLVSPLTGDAATIAAQVPDLATALLPVKGAKRTDLALAEAGELLKRAGRSTGDIILLTADPEDLEAVRAMAAQLRDRGYRTSVLGLGTDQGAPIPLAGGGFQTDERGAIRLSRLRPDPLRAIAAAGGGRYVALTADDADTRALLPEAGRDGDPIEREEDARADQWREEGPWLLVALLPLAALAFRRGWLSPLTLLLGVCLAWVPPPAAQAFGWADLWWRPDQQGARSLAAGDPEQAAARFARPDWRAAAQYQAGDFDQAVATLADQTGAEADYNRGNALAHAGKLREAAAAYERTLAEAPDHADARFNRDLVQRLLAEQEKAQSQASSESQESAQSPEPSSSSSQGEAGEEGGDTAGPRSGQEPETGSGPGQAGESAAQNPSHQPGQPNRQDAQGQQNPPDQQSPSDQQGQQGQQADQQNPSGQQGQQAQPGPQDQQDQRGQLGQQDQQGLDAQHGQQDQQGLQGQQNQQDQQDRQHRQDQQGLQSQQDQQDQQSQGTQPGEGGQPDQTDQTDTGEAGFRGEQARQGAGDEREPGQQQEPPSGQAGAEPGAADLLGGQETDAPPQGQAAAPVPSPVSEARQAMEAQLRRVPDDPGGLLRQRFLLQHLRRQGQLP